MMKHIKGLSPDIKKDGEESQTHTAKYMKDNLVALTLRQRVANSLYKRITLAQYGRGIQKPTHKIRIVRLILTKAFGTKLPEMEHNTWQPRLLQLPEEIVLMIGKRLNAADLYILRQTCRALYSFIPLPFLSSAHIDPVYHVFQRHLFWSLVTRELRGQSQAEQRCCSKCLTTHHVSHFYEEQLRQPPTKRLCVGTAGQYFFCHHLSVNLEKLCSFRPKTHNAAIKMLVRRASPDVHRICLAVTPWLVISPKSVYANFRITTMAIFRPRQPFFCHLRQNMVDRIALCSPAWKPCPHHSLTDASILDQLPEIVHIGQRLGDIHFRCEHQDCPVIFHYQFPVMLLNFTTVRLVVSRRLLDFKGEVSRGAWRDMVDAATSKEWLAAIDAGRLSSEAIARGHYPERPPPLKSETSVSWTC